MQIGYVRVSTNDQNTDLQRQALERAGCEQIFEEKMSGTVAKQVAIIYDVAVCTLYKKFPASKSA
ncbi:recombinase family protein [Enterobacter ludwigii]|uniref:recombinase family protein n=1 Tax=Enterobacter ludwigii TaxID=299767 RepID=UPI0036F269A6